MQNKGEGLLFVAGRSVNESTFYGSHYGASSKKLTVRACRNVSETESTALKEDLSLHCTAYNNLYVHILGIGSPLLDCEYLQYPALTQRDSHTKVKMLK